MKINFGGFVNEQEKFDKEMLFKIQQFHNNNIELLEQCFKGKSKQITKPIKYDDVQSYLKQIISKCTNQTLMTNLKNLLDNIFEKMYEYLYIFSPKKYIENIYKPISNYKILNGENYVIKTITKNTNDKYEYFKILDNGKIDKYIITDEKIIEDKPIYKLYPVILKQSNKNIKDYKIIYNNKFFFENIVYNYCKIVDISKIFGGSIIDESINKLFYLGTNDVLLLNKKNNNIILQFIQTGNFYKLINLNNRITQEFSSNDYKITKDYLIHMFELNFITDKYVFIPNSQYIKIYTDFVNDNSNTTLIEKLTNIFRKYISKNQNGNKYMDTLINHVKFLNTSIDQLNMIDEKLCNLYNKSLIKNIYKRYKTGIKTVLINVPIIFKYANKNYEQIKDLIKVELILLFLPIIINNFISPQINYIFLFYLIRLLETYDSYINRLYVLDKLFANDVKEYTDAPINSIVLNQCHVSYKYNNNSIKQVSCGETTLLNILIYIFLNENKLEIDLKKLKQLLNNKSNIQKNIISFFENNITIINLMSPSACVEFTKLVTNIPNISYVKEINNYHYDLSPDFNNVMKLLFYILDDKIYTNVNYIDLLNKLINIKVIDNNTKYTIINIANIQCKFTNEHAEIISLNENQINKYKYEFYDFFANIIITLYFRKYIEDIPQLTLNYENNIIIEQQIFNLINHFYYNLINIKDFFDKLEFNKLSKDKLINIVEEYYKNDTENSIRYEILISLNKDIETLNMINEYKDYYINTIFYLIISDEKNIIKLRNFTKIFNIYLLFYFLLNKKPDHIFLILKLNYLETYYYDILSLTYNAIFNEKFFTKKILLINTFSILIQYLHIYTTNDIFNNYKSPIKINANLNEINIENKIFYMMDIYTYPKLDYIINISSDKNEVIKFYEQILKFSESPYLIAFDDNYKITDINKKMRCYPTDIHIITRGFYTTNLFEEPTYLEKKIKSEYGNYDVYELEKKIQEIYDSKISNVEKNINIYRTLNEKFSNDYNINILDYEIKDISEEDTNKFIAICFINFPLMKGGYYYKYYKYKSKYLLLKQSKRMK